MQLFSRYIFKLLELQYIRYLIIGILSNIISFFIFYCLVHSGLGIGVSSAIGMIFGILNTYTLGRKYIKKKAIAHSNLQLIVFGFYYAVAVFLTSLSISTLSLILEGNENLAWVLCTIAASLCNYLFISIITLYQKGVF